ncbi:unnamed protein product [Kuraishia capsulata CBS 1993]|uniref:NAD-dependent epimerase/dehydratase domain-containing protein n=1 Tax=Kuraishia capsulata CBS 1993 TaxID=1382522 RepID=W6MLT3_9ASCO|nr:uncharacterized protein KUCA_T00003070001 [Kuraishia capsulata CBS 1993]CDK27093.1 unnamed protein product [Kuraishia capsulata CBS 1993]
MKSISVFGGNGFLGRAICKEAIQRGWTVNSVSRSGKPVQSNEPWVEKVNWVKGDVFQPKTYESVLKTSDAVVHSLGLIWENQDYKKLINLESSGASNPLKTLAQAFQVFTSSKGSNPMEKEVFNTYDGLNHQSAIVLAEAVAENLSDEWPKSFPFVYISADFKSPSPAEYLKSKQITEIELYEMQPQLRPIFMRPGFMYDENNPRNMRHDVKKILELIGKIDTKNLIGLPQTVSIQKVARSILDHVAEQGFVGPVNMDQMQ